MSGADRRIGLAIGRRDACAVVLGPEHEVLARAVLPDNANNYDPPDADPAATVAALLDALGAAAAPERVARIVLAAALTRPLHRPAECARVGVLRIGAPATASVPPFPSWPDRLTAAVRGPVALVAGGHEYDGRVAAPLDRAAVEAFARTCRTRREPVAAVAVTAVHAQANGEHEQEAAVLLADALGPEVPVVTGGDEGGLGLLERENAAILDAALAPTARRVMDGVGAVLAERGLVDELYLVHGDGTVFPAQSAARRPLRTVGALHSSARVGGVHLAGEATVVVIDDDGRRVRVSAAVDGWPQESGRLVEVLGIRTNLREVRVTEAPADAPGPTIARAVAGLTGPLVLVRNARRLPDLLLPGRVLRPDDAPFAAAIGAAVGEAAGTVDRIFWLGERSRAEVVAEARGLAAEAAIRAGADPRRVRIGTVSETLMTYVPTSCIRIRVRAVGPVLTVGAERGRER